MFFKKVGDHMPVKTEVHLPSCLTKGDVYALAVEIMSSKLALLVCEDVTVTVIL